jgi:hypothetical protein
MTIVKEDICKPPAYNGRRRVVKLCPAAEKIIRGIPPYIGLTGDALRATVERCVKAQRAFDSRSNSTASSSTKEK